MIETDAVVIGAGPVGLFQVFELGLLGLRAEVVDSLPVAGGQCVELYADKPIYDIPATVVCTGRELIARLLAQIAPFHAGLHFGQQVDALARQPDGRFLLTTSTQTRLLAKVVIIAAGVGSFQPRRLKIDGLAEYEARQVFYAAPPDDDSLAGQRVVVIGDEDPALEFANRLSTTARVTLLHRRDDFRATPAAVDRLRALRAAGAIDFIAGQPTGSRASDGRLRALQVLAPDGTTQERELDVLVVLTGLSPRLGPIAGWGLALERKQLVVDSASFATSEPGIFAVGDVNTYPGKRRLILCGFHEATLAAYGAAAHAVPGAPIPLEYTTTSPRLHRALGLAAS
ncbi:MAG: NAD(P)/FAD-dependent oxidoreductase [Pseudomonadota bacterium]|nr:NAD(P)/FAD-dependent oxidoreductase [Pseudomonadota bacterium]